MTRVSQFFASLPTSAPLSVTGADFQIAGRGLHEVKTTDFININYW